MLISVPCRACTLPAAYRHAGYHAQVMSECFHQNIVTFYSACMEPHRVR